jgi:hypothetical protein
MNMKNSLGKILLLAGGFCSFLVASTFAQSALVTYNNTVYDVTYEEITPDASSAPNLSTLMAQPWWGNADAAYYFSDQVGGALGYPNDVGFMAPSFAYVIEGNGTIALGADGVGLGSSDPSPLRPPVYSAEFYAVVSPVPDRPGTLTCLSIVSLSLIVVRRYLRPQSAAA